MNPLVRRRLAFGAVTAATSLVVGLVVATPGSASPGGLRIVPNGASNANNAVALTYNGTDADFEFGGSATFSRLGGGKPFTKTISRDTPPTGRNSTGKGTADFTDGGTGLGVDGPADAGTYNVSASGADGDPAGILGGGNDTCTSCFEVLSAGPVTVSSVAPKNLRPGSKSNISVLGNNFEAGSTIQFLFTDGSVDSAITADAAPTSDNTDTGILTTNGITTRKELKRRATVAAGATPGTRDVRVTNLNGNNAVCSGCFFVSGAALTTISKTADFNDPTQGLTTITFNGTNVTNGTPRLEFVGNPGSASRNDLTVPGQNTRDFTGTSITADFDLRNAAPSPSGYQPVVEGAGGVVNACECRFTVIQRDERKPPTLTSLDSDTATVGIQKDIKAGTTVVFTATGTFFSKGVNFTFSRTGLTVTGVTFVSPESADVTITAANTATTGPVDVKAVLTDGATNTNSTSANCTGCLNVTAGSSPGPSSSASATSSSSASPSATATSTISPSSSSSPGACPTTGLTVRVNTKTINATGLASVTVSGARAGAPVELQGYSQNHFGTENFDNDPTPVDRTGTADNDGTVTFNDLRPASNTRLRARQAGCTYNGNSDVINVRAQETLEVKRTGSLRYTFSGKSIPARPGGLIISLYRITGNACAAGVEPRDCSGETFIGQSRASSSNGQYSITITFNSRDRNTRDDFVVKTGQDAQNAPGRSNSRNLAIF